jgi:hypothetical protein
MRPSRRAVKMRRKALTLGWTVAVALTAATAACAHRKASPQVSPGSALEVLKLTCRANSPTTFECPDETIRQVGHALIDAQADVDNGKLDGRACAAELGDCEESLDKWYRKWYVTIPLGVLIAGAAATFWVVGAGL